MGNKVSLWQSSSKHSNYNTIIDAITTANLEYLNEYLSSLSQEELEKLSKHQDKDGSTLLMLAAYYGHENVIDILLMYGADSQIKDHSSRTALFYVIEGCSKTSVSAFSKLFKLNLENHIDDVDNEGNTYLHQSVKYNNEEMVKYLLDEGANRNTFNKDSVTPLHLACDNGNIEITKLLLKKECQLNQTDKSGWTPLHLAAIHNDLELIKILLSKGANINAKDINSNTPLSFARQNNAKEAANYLRKNGAKEFNKSNQYLQKDSYYDDIKHISKSIFVEN